MALINCKECGARVSTTAAACPKCGAPPPAIPLPSPNSGTHSRKFIFWAGLALFFFVVIPTVNSCNKQRDAAEAAAQKQAAVEKRKQTFSAKRDQLFKAATAAWLANNPAGVLQILDPWKDLLDPTLESRRQAAWDATAPQRAEAAKVKAAAAASEAKKRAEQQEAQRAIVARIGEAPVPSAWDGTYHEVERYLKKVANDPDSIEVDACSRAVETDSGWLVRCEYRGKNAFGGMIRKNGAFVIKHGNIVSASDL